MQFCGHIESIDVKREQSSLAPCSIGGLTWFASQNQETQMRRTHVEKAKAESRANPLWVIAIAMAIFFAAATAILTLT
jgi:hypothetical protein